MADSEGQPTSRFWNLVVTAKDHEQRHLARLVKRLGDFWWTPFLGVLIGRVEDHEAFCDQLRRSEEDKPGFLHPLARLVPIDRTFAFHVETLPSQIERAALEYADRIDSGSFYVRIERRGHAGDIHSQSLEQELDRMLMKQLRDQGCDPPHRFRESGCDCGSGTDRGRMWSWSHHPSDAGTLPLREGAVSKKGGSHDSPEASRGGNSQAQGGRVQDRRGPAGPRDV